MLVDIGTAVTTVMDALRAAADGVVKSLPTEFNTKLGGVASLKEGGQPLKMTISVRLGGLQPCLQRGGRAVGGRDALAGRALGGTNGPTTAAHVSG